MFGITLATVLVHVGSLAAHGVNAIDLDAIDVWTYFDAEGERA